MIDTARVWKMREQERSALDSLPEVVALWEARPRYDEQDSGLFYLSPAKALAGAKAVAHTHEISELRQVYIRREFILAIDSDRHMAQVVLDA